MKLIDLPEMPKEYWSIEALVARLAYAKELLSSEIDVTQIPDWSAIKAFIEKLNGEGL